MIGLPALYIVLKLLYLFESQALNLFFQSLQISLVVRRLSLSNCVEAFHCNFIWLLSQVFSRNSPKFFNFYKCSHLSILAQLEQFRIIHVGKGKFRFQTPLAVP